MNPYIFHKPDVLIFKHVQDFFSSLGGKAAHQSGSQTNLSSPSTAVTAEMMTRLQLQAAFHLASEQLDEDLPFQMLRLCSTRGMHS